VQMVWLWTDILLWFLVFTTILGIIIMRQQTQWVLAWRQVLHNKQGIISGLVLLTFVSIGLLDSIHFRLSSSDSTLSVLDYFLWPIGQTFEETYSSPFSLHLFVKKMLVDAQGQTVFTYPRLLWVDPFK